MGDAPPQNPPARRPARPSAGRRRPGRTGAERISDRLIDRNIGVWSNNTHIHGNVGIASSEDSAYFAWQDSRNGNAATNAEDIYFASVKLQGAAPADAEDDGAPAWILIGAGTAIGMGLAMALAYLGEPPAHAVAPPDRSGCTDGSIGPSLQPERRVSHPAGILAGWKRCADWPSSSTV